MNISIDERGTIAFNGSEVVKIIKLNDGYLYELNSIVSSPKSLIEYIQDLSDEYSMFRDSVLKYNVREFDKENSTPKGVDATGSTVYDSIWITTNKFFEIGTGTETSPKGMNIFSENINGTVIIPSNEVVMASKEYAAARMKKWNLTDIPESRPDSIANQWFYKVAFFNEPLTVEQLNNGEDDLYSIFHSTDNKKGIRHAWRPGIQRVHPDPVILSNATVYYAEYLQTPINTLFWRIKDFFWNYNRLTYPQRQELYSFENLDPEIDEETGWLTSVTFSTPYQRWMEGSYSDGKMICKTAQYKVEDREYKNEDGLVYVFEMDTYHFHYENNNSVYYHYLIPPGKYNFYMGLQQDAKHAINIYINDKLQGSLVGAATDWNNFNYDRRKAGLFPFGYDGSLNDNYGRDGGDLGQIIFTEEAGTPVTIKIECTDLAGSTKALPLYCWNFVPTDDCY